MKLHWMLLGVAGVAGIGKADVEFRTLIDSLPDNGGTLRVSRVWEVSTRTGGGAAAIVDLMNDQEETHTAVLYRASPTANVISVARVGDAIYPLNSGEGASQTFSDDFATCFRDLSLSQQGGVDRISFLAFPGKTVVDLNGGAGLYQYNVATGDKVRILGQGDTAPDGGTFSFDGAFKNGLGAIGYQANAAGHVVFGGTATNGQSTDVLLSNATGTLARVADNVTPTRDAPALTGFNGATNLGLTKPVITAAGSAVFLANTTGGAAIVQASAPGAYTTLVGGGAYTPVSLIGATDDVELFGAITSGTQNHAVVLHTHGVGGGTYQVLAQFAYPSDTALNNPGSTGVMTPGGRAAFYAADPADPALAKLYYFDGSTTHEVAHSGQSLDGGFTIDALWTSHPNFMDPLSISNESGPAVNDRGTVAFEAVLHDATDYYRAILEWRQGDSVPAIVVREGGSILLDDRMVDVTSLDGFANNGFGYDASSLKSPLSDDNHLAFGMSYYDPAADAYGSAVVLVPEPSALLLASVPLLALRRRRRA